MKNEDIKNNREGVSADVSGRKNLLVSFGGIQAGLGIPLFEFFNSIADIDCDKVFIRDFHQAWYQMGIDEQVTDQSSLIQLLEEKINAHNYETICFLGNSMGGYAAILFGTRLNVDKVISFSPQSYINRLKRFLTFDRRWNRQIIKIHQFKNNSPEFFDLKKHMNGSSYKSNIDIYYSTNDRLDKIHAERLEGCKGITLHPYHEGQHNIVRIYRDKGELIPIIKAAF